MPSSIVSPFPVFNDLDGTPLEAGYIYIGTANLNPEASPINVFWDAALTVPAAQPIRTVGGYFSRNGSPGNLYTGANGYSITVRNRNQVFVFSALDQATAPDATPGADVTFIQAGTGAVTRTMQDKARETVSPKDFGAVGDGTANDTAAVKLAFESGKVVDGGGLTYGISGTLTPTSFTGLQNANFTQISPSASTGINTLNIVGISNFFIDNVKIDMGSLVTTLFSDDINNGLYVAGAAYNSRINNFKITRVSVTGNGCGTGIHIRHADLYQVDTCNVHDRISGSSPDPTNDSQDGYQLNDCANFVVSNCIVYNLKTRLAGVDRNKWTRGFLFVECRDFNVVGCNSTLADQCYDISGAYVAETSYTGNRRWTFTGCVANNAGTFGFKAANVSKEGVLSGCIANNCGNIGFAFSPSANAGIPEKYNTQNIDVIGCKVINVLGSGTAGTNAEGFRIFSNANYPSYPRGIRFVGCSVSDTQDIPTTLYGFASEATPVRQPTTGYNTNIANYAASCSVGSGVATQYSNVGGNLCSITSSSNQTINDSAWTLIDFPVTLNDSTGLHSTTSSVDTITIKVPGLYSVMARVQFAANATGTRRLRIILNGSEAARTQVIQPAAANIMTVQTDKLIQLSIADTIKVEAYQTSGSPLQLNLPESIFTVCKID